MKNIVLIGMMGCGKSTIGRMLGKKLNRVVIDTDEQIEKESGKTINEIFQTEGEDVFRDLESELVGRLAKGSNLIIATGGGLPLRAENVRALKSNGIIIWLKRNPEDSFDRGNMALRPLAQQGRDAFIARFKDRAPIYSQAADIIIEDFSSPAHTLNSVLTQIRIETENA